MLNLPLKLLPLTALLSAQLLLPAPAHAILTPKVVKLDEVYRLEEGRDRIRPKSMIPVGRPLVHTDWKRTEGEFEDTGPTISFRLRWECEPEFPQYVVELSRTPAFLPQESTAFLVEGNELIRQTKATKEFYWRVLGVGKMRDLSYPSPTKFTSYEERPRDMAPFLKIPSPEKKIEVEEAPDKRYNNPRKSFLTAGLGLGYYHFDENVSPNRNARFSSYDALALTLEGDFPISGEWYVNALVERVPGQMRDPAFPTIQGSNFVANNFWFGTDYHFQPAEDSEATYDTHLFASANFGRLETPFIVLDQVLAPNLKVADLWVLGIGGGIVHHLKRWRFTGKAMYRYPVRSGFGATLFSLSPNYIFDLAISGDYWIDRNWSLGAKGTGRFMDYEFNYPVASQQNHGKASVFASSLEVRGGYSF